MKIGITERGDAALDLSWKDWVKNNPAILITKDPNKLYSVLSSDFEVLPNIIVHASITGWGDSDIEPCVPKTEQSLIGYENLIKLLSNDRVVLRVDPIIPSPEGIQLAKKVVSFAKTRVRISFLDNYPHVKERFKKAQMKPLDYQFHAPFELRKSIYEDLKRIHPLIEVCGEPGFADVGCVSDVDAKILGVQTQKSCAGQRKDCSCIGNKIELLKNRSRCFHKCLYCYWK
jgi:hypothetical protein